MRQDDAKKEAQRILHAPEAQQLLALLSRGGGQTLQQAAAAAQRGDMAGAQSMLKPLLDDPQAAALLEKLRDSFALDENEFGYELRLRAALGEIWLGLLALPRPEARPGAAAFDEKCKAMLAFVHEHYAEPLRIEQIAAAGFCSQREAFRTFQQCLHVTPLNYLQSYRLQMAADRLVRSGQQITAIAVDCGFASLSYFGKVFRQKFGCTPAQFRSKWQDITNTGR